MKKTKKKISFWYDESNTPRYYYIKWIVEFIVLRNILFLFSIFSFDLLSSVLSKSMVFIGFRIKSSRDRILENLSFAFPEKSKTWYNDTMLSYLKKTGILLSEYMFFKKINDPFLKKWLIRLPSDAAHLKAFKGGAIIITGHMGHLEVMATSIAHLHKKKVYAITKRQRNYFATKYINSMRLCQNVIEFYSDQDPRLGVKVLKEGNLLSIPADQDAGKNANFYPFLGRLAATFEGPAFYARNTEVPLYFAWSYHNEKKQLVFDFQEMQRPKIKKTNAKEWNKIFTYTWVKLLEEKIRLHPADYYWLHKRWRTQPEDPQKVWNEWHEWEKKYNLPLSVHLALFICLKKPKTFITNLSCGYLLALSVLVVIEYTVYFASHFQNLKNSYCIHFKASYTT